MHAALETIRLIRLIRGSLFCHLRSETTWRTIGTLPSLVLFVATASCGSSEAADRPPNVVLIVSDDQGYNDLGVNNPEVMTPALDRLAREGVRLTNFYVAWPACTPSRGAADRPLSAAQRRLRHDPERSPRLRTQVFGRRVRGHLRTHRRHGHPRILLPAVLKTAGYRSGIYGKWDLGTLKRYLPLQKGFDDFYGFVNTGIDYFTHEHYGVPSMYDGNEPTTKDKGTYCTDLFRDHGVEFLRANRDKPFLLYLPFNAPHSARISIPSSVRPPRGRPEFKAKFPT